MSHYLSVDEMLEAARDSQLPGIDDYSARIEAVAQQLAEALAKHLCIEVVMTAEADGMAFGGLLAGFGPPEDAPDTPIPDCIRRHDSSSDWAANSK